MDDNAHSSFVEVVYATAERQRIVKLEHEPGMTAGRCGASFGPPRRRCGAGRQGSRVRHIRYARGRGPEARGLRPRRNLPAAQPRSAGDAASAAGTGQCDGTCRPGAGVLQVGSLSKVPLETHDAVFLKVDNDPAAFDISGSAVPEKVGIVPTVLVKGIRNHRCAEQELDLAARHAEFDLFHGIGLEQVALLDVDAVDTRARHEADDRYRQEMAMALDAKQLLQGSGERHGSAS